MTQLERIEAWLARLELACKTTIGHAGHPEEVRRVFRRALAEEEEDLHKQLREAREDLRLERLTSWAHEEEVRRLTEELHDARGPGG